MLLEWFLIKIIWIKEPVSDAKLRMYESFLWKKAKEKTQIIKKNISRICMAFLINVSWWKW